MEITRITNLSEKEQISRAILKDLTDWFALDESREHYIVDAKMQ
ncbi:MAG: hypothetical protein Q4A55_03665 [Aerococcus sp.]|nr:hypothetical protein [Aerococcus sp.]